jgi:hypothetical protein
MPSFVIARVTTNDAGFPEYHFSAKPYVHRTDHGAEQHARAMTRKHEAEFAIFQLVATTQITPTENSDDTPEAG